MRGATEGRQVAVTGMGVVSVCGVGMDRLWHGLLQEPEPLVVRRIPDWDPTPWFSRRDARHADRFTQLAVAAADLAVQDGGLDLTDVDPRRAGVQVGTGFGGASSFEDLIRTVAERGADRASPFSVPMIMPNAGAAAVSIRLGWRGPAEGVVTACAAGTHSVAAGARQVAIGICDVMVVGAADCSLLPATIGAFTTAGAMTASGISRPFDRQRDGFAAAEGAAMLLLEDWDRARARGARVYALIAGAASTADAFDMTAPAPGGSGALECMRSALVDAELPAGQVSHINAHGTSTPLNDAAEATAISALLGGRRVPVTSVKGVLGHAFGAAGALEAAVVCAGFARRQLPPTAGFRAPDEQTAAVDVLTAPMNWEPGVVLSNSFGFGGHNGTLVFTPAGG